MEMAMEDTKKMIVALTTNASFLMKYFVKKWNFVQRSEYFADVWTAFLNIE